MGIPLDVLAVGPTILKPEVPFLVFEVAGLKFAGVQNFINTIKPNDLVELCAEPLNEFDSNAVRVDWQGKKLGYIPRQQNSDMAQRLAAGQQFIAYVNRTEHAILPQSKLMLKIEIKVFTK